MTAESVSAARANSAGPGTSTVKAIRIHRRGGPQALVYEDAPVPALQPGDALVRVHAAGISPAEFTWHIWETPNGRSRLPLIPSHEVSGVVTAVAPEVRDLEVGDAVYGLTDFFRDGGAAEYVAVRTAELARWRGAHVIATASARNVDFVRKLGADDVIDYSATPFETAVRDVDVVPRHDRRHHYGEVLVRAAAERAARHHRQAAIAGVDGRSRGERIVLHRKAASRTIK
jgi:NADPH:quinone reductase-like Zn-dependent oxidoreductase